MTYKNCVMTYINSVPVGQPIGIDDLTGVLADQYSLDTKKAAAAARVALKRILDSDAIPELRRKKRGLYYKTAHTPFGDTEIDRGAAIAKKYINPYKGYETGSGLLCRLGLTTQMPAQQHIVTNAATNGTRLDKELQVIIHPPKTPVTQQNIAYLQILDALQILDTSYITEDYPIQRMAELIKQNNLDYKTLLSLAYRFYPKQTLLNLARAAANDGDSNESA